MCFVVENINQFGGKKHLLGDPLLWLVWAGGIFQGWSPEQVQLYMYHKEIAFQVASDVDVGKVYKVRVGFLGDGREPLWYSNFSHSPSWYLERVRCFS